MARAATSPCRRALSQCSSRTRRGCSSPAACQRGTLPEQYFALRPIFFLEGRVYGSIDTARFIDGERAVGQSLYVVQVGDVPEDGTLAQAHDAFLRTLNARGCLLMGGSFAETSADTQASPCSSMYVISAASLAEAEAVAHEDPVTRAGVACTVRAWTRSL